MSHLSSTKLNEIQNHDDFTVFWVGPDLPDKLKDSPNHVKTFDSCEDCIDEIRKVQSEFKILLVLTDLKSIPDFKDLFQIQSIYILEKGFQNIDRNQEDYRKLAGIFENIDQLIDRLCKDILLICRSDLPISSISPIHETKIEQSLTKLDGNTLIFLWDQVFIYYLVHPIKPNMEKLKEDMLKQCELDYKGNQSQLRHINDFRTTCSYKNALEWYTKDSFLYRLLNQAFRTRNMDFMCKFQYFIILLYENFQDSSKEYNENLSIVYRGQNINQNDLKILKSNVRGLISMNTILSTSRNVEAARAHIFGAPCAVIFKINLPKQTYNLFKPFIDISKFSKISSEEEVLFFVGTIFTIDSIEKENDSTWIVELTLNNDISNHLGNLISDFKPYIPFIKAMIPSLMETDDFKPYIPFIKAILPSFMETDEFNTTIEAMIHSLIKKGDFNMMIELCIPFIKSRHRSIMKTDDFNMIEIYYSILTKKDFSSDNNPTIMIYIHLAFFFSNLGLYEIAIEFYKKALEVENISKTGSEFKVIHIIIGYLHYHLSEYNEAFIHYALVLSLLDENNLIASELYRHIGDVWNAMNYIDTSLSCYEKALDIAKERPLPSLKLIYREIIDIKKKQGKSEAVVFYKNRLKENRPFEYYISLSTWCDSIMLEDCRSRLLNEYEPIKRADLLYKIGLNCVVQGLFEEALQHFLQAKDLYIIQPPPWERFQKHLSTLFDNIAMLYLYSKDYSKTLIMWRKAISIRISSKDPRKDVAT